MRLVPVLAVLQPCADLVLELDESDWGIDLDHPPTCDAPFVDDAARVRPGAACAPGDAAVTDGVGYPTVQAAIDAAPDRGVVLVCPGLMVRVALPAE